MARVRDIKTLQTFTSVQASIHTNFNHPRPLNRRDIFTHGRAAAPGRVASPCSLIVLDCRCFGSSLISLTMPPRSPSWNPGITRGALSVWLLLPGSAIGPARTAVSDATARRPP